MKVAVFSTHKFEQGSLTTAAGSLHELIFIQHPLSAQTASLAKGAEAVCIFVNDDASSVVLQQLADVGIKYVLLRSAGFNHVNIETAHSLGMKVARVPAYSPYAIAEHTVALMLALNRKLVKAHNRIREMNFSLDGLTGFDMFGKTVGIIGTGKIGRILGTILKGFGCRILAYDIAPDENWAREVQADYVSVDVIWRDADIVSLHAPLTQDTKYLVNKEAIALMKNGVMLINTSRGALVNTKDVIDALKTGKMGYLGLDVYEEEKGLFFEDHSEDILQDDVIARLLSFPNVLITSHQAFLTDTALRNIAETTVHNLECFAQHVPGEHEI